MDASGTASCPTHYLYAARLKGSFSMSEPSRSIVKKCEGAMPAPRRSARQQTWRAQRKSVHQRRLRGPALAGAFPEAEARSACFISITDFNSRFCAGVRTSRISKIHSAS